MCAVIGALILQPKGQHFDLIKQVFLQSKIRGMHATGLSYIKGGEVHTEKYPVPADQFPFDFAKYVNEDGNLYMIGHCRYSTSDLEFNQPIGDNKSTIVHNGVITQELPENWEKIYGYKTTTKNDSELVFHSPDPLKEFSHMSMAVCNLTAAAKKLVAYRNGKRPLYLTNLDDGCIITSTADVAKRANINYATYPLQMNVYHSFDENLTMELQRVIIDDAVDYQ